jgi:hypothetical protein
MRRPGGRQFLLAGGTLRRDRPGELDRGRGSRPEGFQVLKHRRQLGCVMSPLLAMMCLLLGVQGLLLAVEGRAPL